MTSPDRQRWNAKHAKAGALGPAHPFVAARFPGLLDQLPARGRVLDVACGRGRNTLHLARLGFHVLAVDLSDVAISQLAAEAGREGLPVDACQRDLVTEGLPEGQFDLLVVTSFLERGLFQAMADAVKPGGFLLFCTFTTAKVEHSGGRFSPSYCLSPGELTRAFPSLKLLVHREHEDEHQEEAAGLFVREV